MPIKIELQQWEINLVLEALGNLPYNQVAATIKGIIEQVERERT